MTLGTLEAAVPPGAVVLLDSAVLIAYLGDEAATPLATVVLDRWIALGRNRAVVSSVSVFELLVRPIRDGTGAFDTASDFIRHFPSLESVAFDDQMAEMAAGLRALMGFDPVDALIVATGLASGATHLITNGRDWAKRLASAGSDAPAVITLADHLGA